MTIYIDPLIAWPQKATSGARHFGNGKQSCHMATDGDIEELHLFAESIGLKRQWFQSHKRMSHYDLTPTRRARAVKAGAVEVPGGELIQRCHNVPNIIVANRDSGAAGVYVGRPGLLGNPYRLTDESQRNEVIEQYRQWLWLRIKERGAVWDRLNSLAKQAVAEEELTLLCYCAPQRCHGDVIANALRWIIRERARSHSDDNTAQ